MKRIGAKGLKAVGLVLIGIAAYVFGRTISPFNYRDNNMAEIIWPSDENADEHSESFRKHSPRCIKGFEAAAIEGNNGPMGGRGGPLNIGFQLKCQCGQDKLFVLGHYWHNEYINQDVFVGPLAALCESCGKRTEIIDTDVHGYDPEIGAGPCAVRGEGEPVKFGCEQCGPVPMVIGVWFEHTGDEFDEDFDQWRGREQDLFTWFTIMGACSKCGRVISITDFECA